MKTLLLSLLLAVGSITAFAATRTVSNRPGDLAEFNSLQAAIDASVDGDIILITGSPISYGDVTVGKRLTLIGPGANPSFNGGASASISTLTFGSSQASKSALLGLSISAINIAAPECDEVQVKRSKVDYIYNGAVDPNRIPQKWLIEETILGNSGLNNQGSNGNLANWSIRNSYSNGTVYLNGSIFSNVVIYSIYGNSILGSQNVITNSIFYYSLTVTNSSIANCIFQTTNTIDSVSNSLSGNLFETDPQFVRLADWWNFYSNDFSLTAGSPGINAGTDGTDIGLFGGKGYLVSGLPGIPQVESLVILNPTVPQNGTLNIKVDGKANN